METQWGRTSDSKSKIDNEGSQSEERIQLISGSTPMLGPEVGRKFNPEEAWPGK